jgi:hypothetical protein
MEREGTVNQGSIADKTGGRVMPGYGISFKDATGRLIEKTAVHASIREAAAWYIECRELEGQMYNLNFFEGVESETLESISATTGAAFDALKNAIVQR